MREKGYGLAANWSLISISLVVVVVLTMLLMYVPATCSVDKEIFDSIRSFLAPYPGYIPLFFSEFGFQNHLLWPQITASAVLLSHRKYLQTFLLLLCVHLTYFTKDLIKNFVCRERPCGALREGFSFPSGHTSVTMCLLGIGIYLVLKYVSNKFWRYFLVTCFGLYIFMVGISRIWIGHHYPIDVLAGAFLGLIIVNLFIILDKLFNR